MESKFFKLNKEISEKETKKLSEYLEKGLEKRPGYVLGIDATEDDKISDYLNSLQKNKLSKKIQPQILKKVNLQIESLNSGKNNNYKLIKEKINALSRIETDLRIITDIIFYYDREIKKLKSQGESNEIKNKIQEYIKKIKTKKEERELIIKEVKNTAVEIEFLKKQIENLENKLNN